jgi:hypothetical protein
MTRARLTLWQIIALLVLLLATMLVPDRSDPSELTAGVDRKEVVSRWGK